jgi:hypothetical protein
LLVLDIVNAHGVLIVQTVWATTLDIARGRRVTDIESFDDPAAFTRHMIATLLPKICWSPETVPLAELLPAAK